MNKKIFTIYSILLVLLGSIGTYLLTAKDNQYILRETIPKKGTFKNDLSMMLETNFNSGEYEMSTASTWPTEGYIFNKELSKCENGGKLDWDPVNNQVLMIGSSSDKCYVYFDKYTSVIINNLSLTSTPTSITATVTATAGSASISKYMFSINNGTYIESDSNVHTFVGLNSSEEYSVSVKAIDSNGRESLVTTELIETSAYVLPSITTVTSNVAWNQIKVTVSASNGTNNVSKYYYSINGGIYQESTSNTYTFSNLNASTAYIIKTKVVDTEGKYSSERTDTISTAAYVAPTITSLSTSVTASTIKVTPVITQGTGTISKYYYSKDGGSSYTESTSNSHTFTGLNGGTTYSIKVYVKDSNGKTSNTYSKSVTTENNLLAAYVKSKYTGTQGSNGIYLHNSSLANSANDGSYRYAGADPNNYVCFGSDASTCPDDNLYRIIGVFGDQVELIKWDYVNSNLLGTNGTYYGTYSSGSDYYQGNSYSNIVGYYWTISSKNLSNVWNESALNTTNLNGAYLSYLGTTWTNKIAETSWKVGGNTLAKIATSAMKTAYQNEIVSPEESTTYSAKIGLMYVSDYGYAASPSYWTYKGWDTATTATTVNTDYRVAKNDNWMYMGLYEWTISRRSDSTHAAFCLYDDGHVHSCNVRNFGYAIRPCFYLNSNVTYTGGTGEKNNPIRIN